MCYFFSVLSSVLQRTCWRAGAGTRC
uniref:Uncharacterized protein n=1 Tax=Anguilla anguilla TaxID=7936 RepID=A0A0E9V8J3_ANGAN